MDAMRGELSCYATWYTEHRPHKALGGKTPSKVFHGLPAANEAPRLILDRVGPSSGWGRSKANLELGSR